MQKMSFTVFVGYSGVEACIEYEVVTRVYLHDSFPGLRRRGSLHPDRAKAEVGVDVTAVRTKCFTTVVLVSRRAN